MRSRCTYAVTGINSGQFRAVNQQAHAVAFAEKILGERRSGPNRMLEQRAGSGQDVGALARIQNQADIGHALLLEDVGIQLDSRHGRCSRQLIWRCGSPL